jgi:hypothetical protein
LCAVPLDRLVNAYGWYRLQFDMKRFCSSWGLRKRVPRNETKGHLAPNKLKSFLRPDAKITAKTARRL